MEVNFYERLNRLALSNGISLTKLINDIGLSSAAATKWKKGGMPSNRTIKQLADYLNVPIPYLLGEEIKIDNGELVESNANLITYPVIGTIKAGYDGTIDNDYTGDYKAIPISELKNQPYEEFFVLRIKGASMWPKLIDGDEILVHTQPSVFSGETAVILYNGNEATVKKVNYVTGEDWMELIPANPEYETKRIEGADLEQCRVIGKVVRLFRDL